MKIYQFLNYNKDTTTEHIGNYKNDRVVKCFDFEDGIQDSINNVNTIKLKEEHRDYFISLTKVIDKHIKIGVRLNLCNESEFKKDIIALFGVNIYSIFLPKIELSDPEIPLL